MPFCLSALTSKCRWRVTVIVSDICPSVSPGPPGPLLNGKCHRRERLINNRYAFKENSGHIMSYSCSSIVVAMQLLPVCVSNLSYMGLHVYYWSNRFLLLDFVSD